MKNNLKFLSRMMLCSALVAGTGMFMTSCSDDNDGPKGFVTVPDYDMPENVPADYTVRNGKITYTEINTGAVTTFTLPQTANDRLPAGTYNIDALMTISYNTGGQTVERSLRAVERQVVINATNTEVDLDWFFYNPESSLVFGEIYFSGSPNAAGTNGLKDSYFTIYNNSDQVQYADGLAIVESKFFNGSTDRILTETNLPANNFTVQTVYVIPGNGSQVAVQPGKSIKIVDQAIDWSAEVAGALNHTDADFEWYDEVTTGSVRDTDNPAVPNLDKWFSYTKTIWIPSNQCNRSYALVRFPAGMTAETFLASQKGDYKYVNAATGKEMNGTNCYLIDYDWILDGVNLVPTETYNASPVLALRPSADAGYAAISDKKTDKNRFGLKFIRKIAGESADGHEILQDTNDSGQDFEVISAK